MFEEMVVSNVKRKKTNKPWTVFVSMVLQVFFLAILILIPLIYTEALPKTLMSSILLAPPPPPPPPPPPAPVQVVHVKPTAHLMEAGKLVAPKVIPKDVKIIKEEERLPTSAPAWSAASPVALLAAPWAACSAALLVARVQPPLLLRQRSPRSASRSAATFKPLTSSIAFSRFIRRWRGRHASAAPSSFTPSSARMVRFSSWKWFPVIRCWCSPRSTLFGSGAINPRFSMANRSKWTPTIDVIFSLDSVGQGACRSRGSCAPSWYAVAEHSCWFR